MPSQHAPGAHSPVNLADPFFRQICARPERAALWVDGQLLSYAQLGERAARIAGWLRDAGISRGQRVGVLASRSTIAYAGVLGTCWAGAAFVPLHPRHPRQRLADLLRRAELSALIVDESGLEALRGELLEFAPAHILVPSEDSLAPVHSATIVPSHLPHTRPMEQPLPMQAGDSAYLMYTSGTTGAPKAVVISVGSVVHFLHVMQQRYRIGAQDRCSQFFEPNFDPSIFDLFMTWGGGACLYAVPDSARLAPARFIREHALTVWFAVPSVIGFMARVQALAPDSLPSLRLSLFCGEALPTEGAQLWRAAAPDSVLENLYGPTEATVACLVESCADEVRVTPGRGIVAIGTPITGTFAAVVDPSSRFLPPGEVGELVLSGVQLADGYWRDEELSARRFLDLDHPKRGRERFYRTGDLAMQDGEGHFHFLGRMDNQVKIQGHRVELEEIDAHLRAITGADAAAICCPAQHGLAASIAAFVTAGGASIDELQGRLRERLPWYMLPRRILLVERLPLTTNGKTDRRVLQSLLEAAPGDTR